MLEVRALHIFLYYDDDYDDDDYDYSTIHGPSCPLVQCTAQGVRWCKAIIDGLTAESRTSPSSKLYYFLL